MSFASTSSTPALDRVVRDELEAAHAWRETAERFTRALVEWRTAEVERLAALQSEAAARTSVMAERRVRAQEEWRARLGLPAETVRLRDIAARLPVDAAGETARLAEELRATYGRLMHVNRMNTMLLAEAVRASREFLLFLSGSEPHEAAYTRRGARPAPAAAGPLFESIA
jgi:hypothetical protein